MALSKNSVSGKANQQKLALQLYNKMVKFLEQEEENRDEWIIEAKNCKTVYLEYGTIFQKNEIRSLIGAGA